MIEEEKNRSGRLTLKAGLNNFIGNLEDEDETKKAYRTAQVLNLFKNAIKHIYQDSAFLILQNTNAVYILQERDKGLRKKAQQSDKLIKRMVVYTCDSMVYADLDSRQEYIKMWLDRHNEHVDKFEIINSKFNMRKRFPYKKEVEDFKQRFINDQDKIQIDHINKQYLQGENLNCIKHEIEKIQNEKLRNSLLKLIKSAI